MSMLLCGNNNPRDLLQARADQNSMAKQVDYDVNVTRLYAAIGRSDWDEASHACKENPIEAETWVIRKERDSETGGVLGSGAGNILWRFLPLHSACARNPPSSFVRDLIRANPDAVCIKDDQGMYALHYACGNRASRGVVRQLLEAFPRAARITDPNGMLPLHYVASWGESERGIVDMLLEANGDALTMGDKDGATPLELAKEGAYEGWKTVVDVIESSYANERCQVSTAESQESSISSTFDSRRSPKAGTKKMPLGHARRQPAPLQRAASTPRGRSSSVTRQRAVSCSPRNAFKRSTSQERTAKRNPSRGGPPSTVCASAVGDEGRTSRDSAYGLSQHARPRFSGQGGVGFRDLDERRDAPVTIDSSSVDDRREYSNLIANLRRDTDAAEARAKAAERHAERSEAEIASLRTQLSDLRTELAERDSLATAYDEAVERVGGVVRSMQSAQSKLVGIVDTAEERETRRIQLAEERKTRLLELIRAEDLAAEAEATDFRCEGGVTIGAAFEKQLGEIDAIRNDIENLKIVRDGAIKGKSQRF